MNTNTTDINQGFDDELSLTYPGNGKQEKNAFILAIKEPAVESRMQKLFEINPKSWNDLKEKGILPFRGSYEQFLVALMNHYRLRNEVSLRKAEVNIERGITSRSRYSETESGLPKVVEAEKIQKIRLDKAREQEVHLKNLATRGELIDKNEEFELVQPLVSNIANILRNAGDEVPEFQPIVDKCFASLYNLGQRLIAQSNVDKDNYVNHMLSTPIDLDKIVESAELENE